tara:strand:+ start:564 stop:1163 length:600 start_codon:yes stop_codon:yes gene_type:complete
METDLSTNINSETDKCQKLSIPLKELNLKICENRNDMRLEELIINTRIILIKHAKNYVHNKADQENLAQSTIVKILQNDRTKEKFLISNTREAYAKKILENLFKDEYRKNKKLVSLENFKTEVKEDIFFDNSLEKEELKKFMKKLNKTDQIILYMKFYEKNTYKEMLEHEHLKNFKEGNLRTMCHRAIQQLTNMMVEKI